MESKDRTKTHVNDMGSIESWLVSAGRDRKAGAPLNIPPWPASNFVLGGHRAYARDDGTPVWEALEEIVGGLEGGSAIAFASGMAGIAAVFEQLPAGAKVALPDDCYQGVAALANAGQQRGRWSVRRIAVTDTAAWIQAGRDSDLMWLESPSNPLLVVAELEQICAAPRKPGAILGVDNTFATPLNQRPLLLGADVSVQSVTKCIGGHSDLLGGVVTVREPALLAALRQSRELAGATPGTLETFLAVRGARTLAAARPAARPGTARTGGSCGVGADDVALRAFRATDRPGDTRTVSGGGSRGRTRAGRVRCRVGAHRCRPPLGTAAHADAGG